MCEFRSYKLSRKILGLNLQIVDIRTPSEWADGILENSICVSFMDDEGELNAKFVDTLSNLLDRNLPVALICHSGKRSIWAAKILARCGYDAINLEGGIGRAIMLGITLVPYLG